MDTTSNKTRKRSAVAATIGTCSDLSVGFVGDVERRSAKFAKAPSGVADNHEMEEASLRLARHLLAEEEMQQRGCARSLNSSSFVRRSSRAIGASLMDSRNYRNVIRLIETNDPSVEVLKLKDHGLGPDASPAAIDGILNSLLYRNTNCQALYIQNYNVGVGDAQLGLLGKVLRKKRIWALNVGEIYRPSPSAWESFSIDLKNSNVTHLYMSEHRSVNPASSEASKQRLLKILRKNRTRQEEDYAAVGGARHCSADNEHVIRKVTHMWFNPASGSIFQRAVAAKKQQKQADDSKKSLMKKELGQKQPASEGKEKSVANIDTYTVKAFEVEQRGESSAKGPPSPLSPAAAMVAQIMADSASPEGSA